MIQHLTLPNGASIAYQLITGDPNLPVLIFLHEGLGSIAMWKNFPTKLAQTLGCSALIYDRQGYGQSSHFTETRDMNYHAVYANDELSPLIDALIPQRPYILIGHSDGGTISLLHAKNQPEHLIGVITEAAHVFIEPETLAGIEQATALYPKGLNTSLKKYHGDKTDDVFFAWSDTWLTERFHHWNIEQELSTITVPLCLIQGKDDQYGTERQVHAIADNTGGTSQIHMIDQCAHIPHHEQATVTCSIMAQFINRLIAH